MTSDNEVWFERWLSSHVPCHPKGWAVLFVPVLAILGAISIQIATASFYNDPWISDLVVIPFAISLVSLLRISRKHSR